jgi:acetylornithine deacetylase
LQATIRTEGRAAHSAYPEQGDSAIEKLLDLLNDTRRIDWPSDDVFGETTCNIGVISGGTRANVIPSEAEALIQIRLAIESPSVKSLLENAIDGRATLDYKSVHDPIRLTSLDGFEQMVARFTTDIPYLSKWGKPLLIGPGSILDAHTDGEKVRKNDLLAAVENYVKIVRRLVLQNREQ